MGQQYLPIEFQNTLGSLRYSTTILSTQTHQKNTRSSTPKRGIP